MAILQCIYYKRHKMRKMNLMQTQVAFFTKLVRFYYNFRQVLQCEAKIDKTRAESTESLRSIVMCILSFKTICKP